MSGGKAAISVGHSSAFVAAVIDDNDETEEEDGGHDCYFCFLFPGSQNRSFIRNRKRYCQLYQKH